MDSILTSSRIQDWRFTFGEKDHAHDSSIFKFDPNEAHVYGDKDWNCLQTVDTYNDIDLRFDYKVEKDAHFLVALRISEQDRPKESSIHVDINDCFGKSSQVGISGTVMGFICPMMNLCLNTETWNSVHIDLNGWIIRVTINDLTVVNMDLDLLPHPYRPSYPKSGPIGFLRRNTHPFRLRNVRVL